MFKSISHIFSALLLLVVTSSAFAYPAPPPNLTGTWEVFSTNSLDNSTVKGILRIQHDMHTGFVTATSTSGGSRWTGHFGRWSRVLKADFRNSQITGKIYLQYRYSDELVGKWFANTKDKGTYKAVRMK